MSCGHDVEDSEGNSTLMEGTVDFGKRKSRFQDLRKRNSVGRIQCQKLSNTVSLLWEFCVFFSDHTVPGSRGLRVFLRRHVSVPAG